MRNLIEHLPSQGIKSGNKPQKGHVKGKKKLGREITFRYLKVTTCELETDKESANPSTHSQNQLKYDAHAVNYLI